MGVSVETVGSAMARFASVGRDLGLVNADVANLTETFLKAGRIFGQTG